MKKFKSAFFKSLAFVIISHLILILLLVATDSFGFNEFITDLPLSISLLFIPAFLSYLFFNKGYKISIFALIPSLLASLLGFYITFIFFRYIRSEEEHSLFEYANIFSGIVAFFLALFFTIFQNIREKSKLVVNNNLKDFKYSYLKLFLIPLSGAIIYSIVIIIEDVNTQDLILIFYKFLPIGFIFSLISIHFFNYVYSKYPSNKRVYYVISYYIISISILVFWIIISYADFRIVKDGLGPSLARAFLIPTIMLYFPFFFYSLVVTQLYFVSIISKQEKTILKQQSLESQLNYQQLKNQLSPHFLFNNINVLTSLIEENPKKAVSFSENLSHIYRYFLEQEKQDVILVKDEISFAKSYLELLKDRFEVGLNFTINIDEKDNQKYIVATILQQVLENVVKHNEISKEHVVEVKISSKENYLVIENNINPKLKTEEFVSKKGLENIKQRIAFFTDKKVIVKETSKMFRIELPILEIV